MELNWFGLESKILQMGGKLLQQRRELFGKVPVSVETHWLQQRRALFGKVPVSVETREQKRGGD